MNRLPREFLWKDVESMDNFLDDTFNNELYKVYKTVKENPFKILMPDVKVFNELYYICVGLRFRDFYTDEIEEIIMADLGHKYAPSLLISMIFAVYAVQDENIKESFPDYFSSGLLCRGGWYFDVFQNFANNQKATYKTDFSPRPEKALNIIKRNYDWEKITYCYNDDDVLRVLSLWRKEEEKLLIIDAIETAHKNYHNDGSLIQKRDGSLIMPMDIDFLKFREYIITHKEVSIPVVNKKEITGFASYVINKDKAKEVVTLLHQFIDGKNKPQAASIPIRAAIDAKKLLKPTWEIYNNEFPNCKNSRTSFEKYTGASFDTTVDFKGKEIYKEMVAIFGAI